MVRDPDDAADIGVETMLRAFQRWDRIERYAARWVVRTASNLAIDQLRRGPAPTIRAASPRDSLEAGVVSDAVVTAMLRRLPRRQREAVALTVLCGYDVASVSEILGVSRSSVKTHVRRGLEALRRAHMLDEQEVTQWLSTT